MRALVVALPTALTLLRFGLVPIAVDAVLDRRLAVAFLAFVIAGVTDALDGAIARLCNARTRLGGYLDPLADKALLVTVGLALSWIEMLPLWLVVLMVVRDVMIVGVVAAFHLSHRPPPIEPLFISKLNTTAQIILFAYVLGVVGALIEPVINPAWLVWATAATTLASGVAYGMKGWQRVQQNRRTPRETGA